VASCLHQQRRDTKQGLGVGRDARVQQLHQRLAVRRCERSRRRRGGDGLAKRLCEAIRFRRRVSATSLHRHAIGVCELSDHTRMGEIKASAEAGTPGADQKRHTRSRLANPDGVRRQAPLRVLACREGECQSRVGRDFPALFGGVGHRHEHTNDRLVAVEPGPEGRGVGDVGQPTAPLEGEVERLESRWFAKLIAPGPDQRHGADRLSQETEVVAVQRRGDAQVESYARIGGCGRRPDVASE
jgi:hypothetical protein